MPGELAAAAVVAVAARPTAAEAAAAAAEVARMPGSTENFAVVGLRTGLQSLLLPTAAAAAAAVVVAAAVVRLLRTPLQYCWHTSQLSVSCLSTHSSGKAAHGCTNGTEKKKKVQNALEVLRKTPEGFDLFYLRKQ